MPDPAESPQLSYKDLKCDVSAMKTDLDAQALRFDVKKVIQTLPVSGNRDSGEKHASSIQTENWSRHTPELVSELEETLRLKIKNV